MHFYALWCIFEVITLVGDKVWQPTYIIISKMYCTVETQRHKIGDGWVDQSFKP